MSMWVFSDFKERLKKVANDFFKVLDQFVALVDIKQPWHLKITGNELLCHVHSLNIKRILFAQRGARTHDPEIKSLMLYRLS